MLSSGAAHRQSPALDILESGHESAPMRSLSRRSKPRMTPSEPRFGPEPAAITPSLSLQWALTTAIVVGVEGGAAPGPPLPSWSRSGAPVIA